MSIDSDSDSLGEKTRRAVVEIHDFLNDIKPPLFVAEALSFVFRTEPPIHVGTQRAVDIVADWALDRAARSGARASDLMLSATSRIIDAYRTNSIEGFDPKVFYRPFVLGLAARVPAEDRNDFQAGLRQLQSDLPQRWRPVTTSEFGETEGVEIRGRTMRVEHALHELLGRLAENRSMPDAEFDETMADMDRVLSSRVGLAVHAALTKVASTGLAYFNASMVGRAARIFGLLTVVFDRLHIGPDRQGEIQVVASLSALDPMVLGAWLGDPARRSEIEPVVRFVPEFQPGELIEALFAPETRGERRRLVRGAIEVYGEEIFSELHALLTSPKVRTYDREVTRDLLALVASTASTPIQRRTAAAVIGPYATGDDGALRGAALTALRRLGGKEAIPALMRAVEPSSYRSLETEVPEALLQTLGQAASVLVDANTDMTLAAVAEMAVGTRGAGFKLDPELRRVATEALARRMEPLPERAEAVIAGHLRALLGRRFKLVTGFLTLGIDVPTVRSVVALVETSKNPEIVELLANPTLRKIVTKGGTGMLGG